MTVRETDRKPKSIWQKIWRLIGLPLAVLPFIWIVWRLDFNRLVECTRQVAWWTLPVLAGFILLSMTLQGVRWWILLRALTPGLSFSRAMAYHFTGIFYSIVLPTSASTDVIKTVLVSRRFDYSVAWGAAWLCRIMGFLVLIIFSLYGLFAIDRQVLPQGFWYVIAVSIAVAAASIVLSFSKRITAPLRPLVTRLMPARAVAVIERVREGIYLFRHKHGALVLMFLVTLVTQAALILTGCFTLYGIVGELYLREYMAFVPIIEVVANSGPTPNGIGMREALTALLFRFLHLSNEHLGIYVFITLFFGVALRLVGGIPVFYGMLKRRRASGSSL